MNKSTKNGQPKKTLKLLITFASIGVVIAAFFAFAPKGFDLDLTKIGNGKPALVFVYDSNLGVSSKQAAIINLVRETTPTKMHFLMAKVGRPDAKAFVSQYNLRTADLVLLDEEGQVLKIEPGLLTEEQLKAMIKPVTRH